MLLVYCYNTSMKKFEEMKFNIGELKDISAKNITEHLKLYSGYVKNANIAVEKIGELMADPEKNMFVLGEMHRRFSFEFNGIRNHEYYFKSFEDSPKNLEEKSELKKAIIEEFGDFDKWLQRFKAIAMTRGVGWAMLYYDPHTKQLLNQWVDEQHLGQLNGCQTILSLDMWEHAFVADYEPSGKKQYIEDFFENLNWKKIENNFLVASSQ